MIEGAVNADFEAVIPVTIQGPSGQIRTVDAVVDTGFNQFLTLPPRLLAELGLVSAGTAPILLADGSEVRMEVYQVTLLWDQLLRRIDIFAAESTSFVGMRLLRGHNLHIDVLPGGRVAINALA